MTRQTRFTALMLAVSLLCNTALPVMAEGSADVPSFIEVAAVAEETTAPAEETTTPAEEVTDPTQETTYPMPQYKLEGSTLRISSARELVMLSHVDPQEYCNLNLTFCPSNEENAGFDLLTNAGDLQFQGLGDAEHPFRGEILFAQQTGPIALNRPLFNVLSDDAKITGLSLESHVRGIAEGGLLANTVNHGQGGNTWTITLTQPKSEENTEFNLPPLIFNLGNNADVSLDMTDHSGLSVLGSGYLCAVMGENARLTLSGIDTIPSVTGCSDAVGGLIGLMKSGAKLTVLGESIAISGISGDWNAGGIVGSATNPLLSLPTVTGSDDAVVGGVNVGGLIGRVTYTPGDHALSLSLANLTLEGSENVGGLFGVLLRDGGTLSLDVQVENVVLTEDTINRGSLFGTYYTSSLEDMLLLNGEPIADEAGLEALAGLVDYPGKPEIFITLEDAQAIIDSILSAELKPGEMSPLWWTVVSGRLTAEELAAQLNAYFSSTTETSPETDPSDPTEASEPQKADDLPQENTQEEADSPSAVAYFSAKSEARSTISIVDQLIAPYSLANSAEGAPASQEDAPAEPASALPESFLSTYAAISTLPWPAGKGQYEIKSVEDLVLLSYVAPTSYANGTITIDITSSYILDLTKAYDINIDEKTSLNLSFQSLGGFGEGEGFSGTIVLAETSTDTYIKLNQPLFKALSDNATIGRLNLYSGLLEALPDTDPAALLANKVTHAESTTEQTIKTWGIKLRGISGRSSLSLIGTMGENSLVKIDLSLCVGTIQTTDDGDTENSFTSIASCSSLTVRSGGYLCSLMEQNAALTVTLSQNSTVYNGGAATALGVPKVTSSGNVGGLVGTMNAGAKLTVNAGSALPISDVESTDGNAGGLVGYMDDRACLTVSLTGDDAVLTISNITAPTAFSDSPSSGKAGGLVGFAKNPVLVHPKIVPATGTTTIHASSAGGLIGRLDITRTSSFTLTQEITDLILNGTESSGGLFSEIHNDGDTVNGEIVPSVYTISTGSKTIHVTLNGENAGGLIGRYYTNALTNSLVVNSAAVTSVCSRSSWYGGIIGNVESSVAAYVELNSITVNTGGNPDNFGGLIGRLKDNTNETDNGHVVKVGKAEVATAPNCGGTVGGVVGSMECGVLYLTEQPTFNLPQLKNANIANRGWILGHRGNTLVYTTSATWTVQDESQYTNDTGCWGQVLRLTGELTDFNLTIDPSTHVLNVPALTTSNGEIVVANAVDFAKVALRLQYKPLSCLTFGLETEGADSDDIDSPSQPVVLSVTGNVDLSSTGLTGLMRDYSTDVDDTSYSMEIYGAAKATTITLPSVKVFASENPIAHNRQGLISRAASLTVENLTITTQDEYQIHILTANNGIENQTYVGMLAAHVTKSPLILTSVTSTAELYIDAADCNTLAKVGGIIGITGKETAQIALTDCAWTGSITDNCISSTYLGGFISILSNESTSAKPSVTVENCRIGGSIEKKQASTKYSNYTPVGGFICTMYYGTTTLNIDGLVADGVNITIEGTTTKCGGILSYDWVNMNATVKNVTVKNCTLSYPTSTSKPQFGALVYKANGICTLGEGETPGITFERPTPTEENPNPVTSITGYSPASAPSSLCFAYGFEGGNGLYLQVMKNGLVIEEGAVSLDLTYGDSRKFFDELVGITWINEEKGMGIVSIATAERKIDMKGRNTYKNQTTDKNGGVYTNPFTRYYYDLDSFRQSKTTNGQSTVSGAVNTAEKMVLLSAWGNCTQNLRNEKYFYNGNPGTITDDLNLTGYSYYPIPFSGQSINNATITFDHKALVDVETADSNKSPSDPCNQHTLMHTGIFRNMKLTTSSTNMTVNVTNLTLQGNIGQHMDKGGTYSYGALFCGTVQGADVEHIAELNIDGISLDGIQVYDTTSRTLGLSAGKANAPLLIATIGSYVTLSMDKVETMPGKYTAGTYAASSLIGTVGSETGTNIKLTFANMGLDGRTAAGTADWQGTKQTIFTKALFIETFRYSDAPTCKGIYNFSEIDPYTCGQELSNNDPGLVGRNNDEQFWFFKHKDEDDYLVYRDAHKKLSPETATDKNQTTYFQSGFLRYVGNIEGKGNDPTYHELDVNLWKAPLDRGCGTYSHPYIIYSGQQLMALAEVLENGTNPGWEVNLNTKVLGKPFNQQDGHISTDPADLLFTCEGDNWVVAANPETTAAGTDVLNYLRNAYYLIQADVDPVDGSQIIKLNTKWGGLGKPTTTGAFSGVISGVKGDNTVIQIAGTNTPVYQYGGLVKCSMGSVVKDVTIQYTGSPRIRSESVPSSAKYSEVSFFGGVVGWCMGGDTILENVSISYGEEAAPVIHGDKSHLAAVGGYVGLAGGGTDIGGFGGGVVFRSISGSYLPNVTVGSGTVNPASDTGFLYVNPYVGRVLDGYAMSENTALDNTEKNYSIPGITVDESHLSISDNAIEVNDAQGLWILSAIVNSGLRETAYTYGKPRTADYTGIGTAVPQLTDEVCLGGTTTGTRGCSYLTKFTGIPDMAGPFQLTFTGDCDVSNMGNGFRGLGGSYGTTGSNRMLCVSKVTSKDGTNALVKLGQDRREYTDEAAAWTSIGAGLFPVLYPAAGLEVSNLPLSGTTGITYYGAGGGPTGNPIPKECCLMDVTAPDKTAPHRLGSSGAGLLAGTMKNGATSAISLTNLTVCGSVTGSATFAGGLIGLACISSNSTNKLSSLILTNCVYSGLTVNGHACVGGFLGYAFADTLKVIAKDTDKTMTGPLAVSSDSAEINLALTGVGGLIGRCDTAELTLGSEDTAKLIFSGDLTVTNRNQATTADRFATGGLVGLLGIRSDGSSSIQNIAVNANVSISNPGSMINSSGIIAGILGNYNEAPFSMKSEVNKQWEWTNPHSVHATISGIDIVNGAGSVTIQQTKQGGTLFGWLKAASADISGINIGSNSCKVTLKAAEVENDSALGGLIGTASNAKPLNLSGISIRNTTVQGLPGNGNQGTSLLLGFAEHGVQFQLRDVTLKNSTVTVASNDRSAGFLFSQFNGDYVKGYDILIDGCTIGLALDASKNPTVSDPVSIGLKSNTNNSYISYGDMTKDDYASYSAKKIGIIGGRTEKAVSLVGVSVKDCKAPTQDFGENSTAVRYAVRADYTGKAGETTSNITLLPTLSLPGVSMRGDGIGMENATPYAQTIMEDAAVPTGSTYFNAATVIEDFAAVASVSTFRTKETSENTFTEEFADFPVLVFNSNEGDMADTIIWDYITILTNVPNPQSSVTGIDIDCMRWNEETKEFESAPNQASLSIDNAKVFSIVPGGYDNQRMQFTLLDVTYADPTGGEVPYHLYIPVIVKRVMRFKFWASAENGSSHYAPHYGRLIQSAIGSNKDLITSLLTFQYQWTKEDWQAAVNNGLDLLWNFDKEVVFFYNSTFRLPDTTRLTLVDCNNQDLAYYGSYSSENISFSSLRSLSDNTLWSSSDAPLCDLLKLMEVAYDSTKDLGKFVRCEETDDARTLRIGNQYYRPANDNDPEENLCSIQVGLGANELVKETYYLSLQTQFDAAEQSVCNMEIQCGARLKNPTGKTGLPTTWIPYSTSHDYSKTGNENRVVISNFYSQTMTLTTGESPEIMSSLNDSISGSLSATVSFLTAEGYGIFVGQKENRELMQQFCLSLKDQDNNPVPFPAGTAIQVGDTWYSVDQGYSYWLPIQEVTNWAPNAAGNQTSTVSTTFTLRFTTEGIISTFPERVSGTDGIQVCASSSLSLNPDALERSNQRASGDDQANRRFYRKEMSLAALSYNAYDIAFPDQASGLSNLGINGWESSPASIPSAAIYDASALKNTANAERLKCSIDLLCKNVNDDGYTIVASSAGKPLPLSSYLSSIVITPKVSVNGSYTPVASEGGFIFTLPESGIYWHSPVQIDVKMDVISGEDFEREHMYANYKVLLTVELLDDNGNTLDGSFANDYIIYTNTKIIKELIS